MKHQWNIYRDECFRCHLCIFDEPRRVGYAGMRGGIVRDLGRWPYRKPLPKCELPEGLPQWGGDSVEWQS